MVINFIIWINKLDLTKTETAEFGYPFNFD